MEEVKLFVSVPSNRDWKSGFGSSLAHMVNHLSSGRFNVPGYTMATYFMRVYGNSSCLSVARQNFVEECKIGGFTHWLSLDDDMTFPPNIVDRLLAHGKDVVSCNARYKVEDYIGSCQDMNGKPIDSRGKTGLEELMTMGGAIFLAKVDCFRNIPKPNFQVVWSEAHNAYVSEDIYFAAQLKHHGVRLWCDHDVSQEIYHIGEHYYGWKKNENLAYANTKFEGKDPIAKEPIPTSIVAEHSAHALRGSGVPQPVYVKTKKDAA